MSYVQRHTVSVTTDASGAATAYTPVVTGRVVNVVYTKTDYAVGVDFTVTAEGTGQAIWTGTDVNASTTVAPRQPTHGTDGSASLYAGAGEPIEDQIYLAGDRVKIVVAAGGNAKTGAFAVVVA